MALVTLGRMPFTSQALENYDKAISDAATSVDSARSRGAGPAFADDTEKVKTDLDSAESELATARADLLEQLAPWIPGDFVVVYGALLTAWAAIRNDFLWLIVVAVASAIVFVIGSAFADQGLKGVKEKRSPLLMRTLVGIPICVLAALAIPNSGWSQFEWFVNNEASVVLTASVVGIVPIAYLLRGISKSTGVKLTKPKS